MTTVENKRVSKEERVSKQKFKDWYKKKGYAEHGGHARFCRKTGCPKGTLSGWLNDKDPSPLPWFLPLIMGLDLRGNDETN